MPSGSFVGETVDADLIWAILGPAREADAVSLGLSPTNLFGVIFDFVGRSVVAVRLDGRRQRCWGRVARRHADHDRAVGAATRLSLFVCAGLGFGLTLHLLQTATLAQRGTHHAAAVLADAAALVSELLLFFFGQFWFGLVNPIRRAHPGALAPRVWRSGVWRISHGEHKYRCIPASGIM